LRKHKNNATNIILINVVIIMLNVNVNMVANIKVTG
jgi:hypothetical protein